MCNFSVYDLCDSRAARLCEFYWYVRPAGEELLPNTLRSQRFCRKDDFLESRYWPH
jgi:hypothetical protein